MSGDDQKAVGNQDRLAAIGQISAGIAHEIRNPLTAVKGFLQLMQKEQDSPYWDIVNSELNQAISTVQNLLTVSKPERNDETFNQVNICSLMESTLSLFHNEMYRVKIEKRFYNTALVIYGKRNQLKRAFFNLLKNSLEAIEGEGAITIEHFREQDNLCLIIKDTGKGIPRDKLELLGTPFFTTKADIGTGLGLAQVYSTIHEHDGTVEVESEEGKGTAFIIRLPLANHQVEGSRPMNLVYKKGIDVREFFDLNRQAFNSQLESEAKTTFEVVAKSSNVTTRDLIDHANQILALIHDGLTQEIIELARERGIAWAKSDIPIISKMEWFYALRKVIWSFLRFYHISNEISAEQAFEVADRINDALDNFIIHFNVNFTKYRDEILKTKEAIIEELTVPLIPISGEIAVLPLIGALDQGRILKLQDKLLDDIETQKYRKIYIDLSGTNIVNPVAFKQLIRVSEGAGLLGCQAVLTGISAKLAKLMLDLQNEIREKLHIESSLQQALIKDFHIGR